MTECGIQVTLQNIPPSQTTIEQSAALFVEPSSQVFEAVIYQYPPIKVTIQRTPAVLVGLPAAQGPAGPQGPQGPVGPGGVYYTFQEISASQPALVNYWYSCNNSSTITLRLPGIASPGDKLKITGKGAGGWKISQNAGQIIHYGNQDTTMGPGGSLASELTFDCIELVCISPNTDWLVHSSQGNILVT